MCVDHLVETDDVRVLKFFHSLNLALDSLLHAKFPDFVLIVDLHRNWDIDCFIDSKLDFAIGALAKSTAKAVVAHIRVVRGHRLFVYLEIYLLLRNILINLI